MYFCGYGVVGGERGRRFVRNLVSNVSGTARVGAEGGMCRCVAVPGGRVRGVGGCAATN